MAVNIPNLQPSVSPIVEGISRGNALTDQMMKTKMDQIQARYAPISARADVASKLAYANLMGPQFLAKLMGNDSALANMSESQKKQALDMLYRTGSGQGTGNALMSNDQESMSPLDWIGNKIKNVFSDNSQPGNIQQPQQNVLSSMARPNLSNQDQNNISRMQPGDSYTIQGSGELPLQNIGYNRNNENDYSSQNIPQKQQTYAEKTGAYKGVVEEGQEAGKIRAQDIKDLNDSVFNADTKLATLNDLNDMIASPQMREIRQLPLAGSHELSWYSKEGTPEQQQLIGRIKSQLGNVIKDSSRDFAGQFRKGEQQLLSGMKANDSDTIDTMIGKQESLTTMTQMLRDRSALTSKYMDKFHINKLQAQDLADKQINGDAIRSKVHNKLNPKPTDLDINFMANKYKTTPDEIRKRLRLKGIL
jgi:hypothetical protein